MRVILKKNQVNTTIKKSFTDIIESIAFLIDRKFIASIKTNQIIRSFLIEIQKTLFYKTNQYIFFLFFIDVIKG